MKPSPPMNISAMMKTCPVRLQYVAVSWTTSPVTVAADVAVNRAVTTGVNPPLRLLTGSNRSSVPTRIIPAKI